MSLTELVLKLQALPRAEKLQLAQFLLSEIAKEEGIASLEANKNYPIWTPYNAFDAANTLLDALKEEQITYDD